MVYFKNKNMNNISIAFAKANDEQAIKDLLFEAKLPNDDIGDHIEHFLVARRKKDIIGAVGLEVYGGFGLLRSLVVKPSCQGKGIGKMLYEKILGYAHLKGVEKLFLLTTTAENFFTNLDFCVTKRTKAPLVIQQTKQFKSLCPQNAACMTKNISKEMHYYPKEILQLQHEVSGYKMWGIALKKTMMTCFEIEPHKRFKRHTHKSEQITLVMEGELFFETEDGVIGVKKGEVMALPSNLPHAAFTKDRAVKAIDAWSPVMDKYKGKKR